MDDLYMPAEWHPHSQCWMAFPHRQASWTIPLAQAQQAVLQVAHAIAQFEPVTLLCRPEQVATAQAQCQANVTVLPFITDDIWLRDTGPTFVINRDTQQLTGLNWQFNAWGEACEALADYQNDVQLANRILTHLNVPSVDAPLVLEGGAIHVDGEGTLLTTEQCLLNPNRNPQLNRAEITELLTHYLGIQQIIWLGEGLQDDETSGHIDNLACFIQPSVVLAIGCDDPADSNYPAIQDNLHRLRTATDAQGRELTVLEMPQPQRRDHPQLGRLTASYLNFYLANWGIILPTFEDAETDLQAIQIMTRLFPNHRLVTVPGLDLLHGGGCVHCITQQQPTL